MDKMKALQCIIYGDFQSVPESFYKDKSFVLEAVKRNGMALEYADKSLKKDKSIVLVAIKQDAEAFEFVDESLKNDPDVIKAVKK